MAFIQANNIDEKERRQRALSEMNAGLENILKGWQGVENKGLERDKLALDKDKFDSEQSLNEIKAYTELAKDRDISFNDFTTARKNQKSLSNPVKKEKSAWEKLTTFFDDDEEVIDEPVTGEKAKGIDALLKDAPVKLKAGDAFSRESSMRKEINNLPEVKNYKIINSGFSKMNSAFSEKGEVTAAGDMALVFGFMKIQDPNSTVREGEYANAENTTGIADRVLNLYNKAKEGIRLTPEQRKNFMEVAQRQVTDEKKTFQKVLKNYERAIKSYNLNRENILFDLEEEHSLAPQRVPPSDSSSIIPNANAGQSVNPEKQMKINRMEELRRKKYSNQNNQAR